MDYIVTLVLGDPSHDGHNQEEKFTYKSNYSESDIRKAYRESCEKLGFDFSSTCCSDYEDATIRKRYVDILVKHDILYLPKHEDGECYYPKDKCDPCHGCLCVRKEDWVDGEPETEYLYDENNNYIGRRELPVEKVFALDDGTYSFAKIWIKIVKLSLPDLVMEKCSDYRNEIYIGGYGLFWS